MHDLMDEVRATLFGIGVLAAIYVLVKALTLDVTKRRRRRAGHRQNLDK